MLRESRISKNKITASAAAVVVALGLTGTAQANHNGGASYESARLAPAKPNNSPCPSANKINRKNMKAPCRSFLMRALRSSVYDDSSDTHAVATYQKIAKLPGVDGDLGPITARSILKGRALRVAAPVKSSVHNELFIRKSDQVAFVLDHGKVKNIISVSTGTEQPYSQIGSDNKLNEGDGKTPTGSWKINERVMGKEYTAPLGSMPYARFYDGGFAIHGGNVSLDGRDSHGCTRVQQQTMAELIAPIFDTGDTITVSEK